MNAELELLRAFYLSWERMHSIINTSGIRREREAAAQELTDNAHALRNLYHPAQYMEAEH